jgi:hypothetical protein
MVTGAMLLAMRLMLGPGQAPRCALYILQPLASGCSSRTRQMESKAGTIHQMMNCCWDEATYNNADDDAVAGKIVTKLGRVSLAGWAGSSDDMSATGVQKSAVPTFVSTPCRSCLQLAAPASTQQHGVQ